MQGLQHFPLHTQSNQQLDKTHDEWCNWRWQQSNATSLSVWGERRVASGWLPYRIYCYCCLIKKYWDCLPTFEHLQQQNEIIHTTGLHLYIIVFVCLCKCIKQIHKAFPPSSSLHLRLTLLFLTLSIKSSSPLKKVMWSDGSVCLPVGQRQKGGMRRNSTCALHRSNARLAQIKSWQRSLTAASHTVSLTSTQELPDKHRPPLPLLRDSMGAGISPLNVHALTWPWFATIYWGALSPLMEPVLWHMRGGFHLERLRELLQRLTVETHSSLLSDCCTYLTYRI